ncbi:MAG: stage II sporulation protein M [Clostridium sp.]|jgi:hypothetical protein|nr:stage II sporulation protein M [Clostridium sp.]
MRCSAAKSCRRGDFMRETIRGIAANKRLLLLLGLFLAGMLAGARLCRAEEGFFARQGELLFEAWLSPREARSFLGVLLPSLGCNLIFVLVAVLLGFSVAGVPLIGILPLLRGLGAGLICGRLYADFALVGLAAATLTLIPGTLCAVFGLLLLCRESMESAAALGSAAKNSAMPEEWRGLREHMLRCGALTLFAFAGAVLDAAGAAAFGGIVF